LSDVPGVKVAAFVRLAPDGFLGAHRHPELREEGLLQMHLTLEAADEANYAYLNVEGEFRQHVPGEGFVFDGSLDHFALNASPEDRVILYLEFRPSPSR
jgi:beta-hydroxylase